MAGVRNEGRRRLTVLLCGLGGAGCAGAMLLVLLLYGAPYNSIWWAVMAVILAAAFVAPRALVPLVDWVIEGYREARDD